MTEIAAVLVVGFIGFLMSVYQSVRLKRAIAYIISPVLFYIGDFLSMAPDWLPEWIGFPLAVAYQKTMAGSILIEDWADVEIMWVGDE